MLYLAYYQPFTLAGENFHEIVEDKKKKNRIVKSKNELLEDVITSHSNLVVAKDRGDEGGDETVVKDTMDDFMRKVRQKREIDYLSRNEAVNLKQHGGGNLIPDSEDEDSKMPKVLYTLINFKGEEEEVSGEENEFDYLKEKNRVENQVGPQPDYFNPNMDQKKNFNFNVNTQPNQFISDEDDESFNFKYANAKEDFTQFKKKDFFK